MQDESHPKARFLLDQAMVEALSLDEQRWLNRHTEECAECSRYGELSRRAIRALDCFAFELDPVAALRVENAIRSRANRLASNAVHGRGFFVGAVVATVLYMRKSRRHSAPTGLLQSMDQLFRSHAKPAAPQPGLVKPVHEPLKDWW